MTIRPGPRVPPVRSEHETDPPISDTEALLEQVGEAIDTGDRELILGALRSFGQGLLAKRDEREARKASTHAAVVEGFRATIEDLKSDLKRRDDEVRWYREKYEREDKDRDTRLGKLEEAIAQRTAPRVHELNKPDTEATASAATATMLNLRRGSETKWKALLLFLTVVLAIMQLLGVRLPDTKPNVSLPDTRPQPAGTGFAGAP